MRTKHEVKIRPILFSTEMVQAILAGRKTMTRRILKVPNGMDFVSLHSEKHSVHFYDGFFDGAEAHCYRKNKFGVIGDILYVRETYCFIKEADCEGMITQNYYKADHHPANDEWFEEFYKWTPSIFMPKSAARIFLKIKDIRVERLKSISEQDAIAEGISPLLQSKAQHAMNGDLYRDYTKPVELFNDGVGPIASYMTLWSKINGINSWLSNPWVWVISFERIEKPENFI